MTGVVADPESATSNTATQSSTSVSTVTANTITPATPVVIAQSPSQVPAPRVNSPSAIAPITEPKRIGGRIVSYYIL